MIEPTPRLSSVYKGWNHHQHLLRETVSSLAADQLALRAAPHLRSIGELAAHVIAVRARCLNCYLGSRRSGRMLPTVGRS
jgi:hypothetical protein